MLTASRSGFLYSILIGWNPKSIKHTFYAILKRGTGEFHILFESLLEKMIQGPHLDMCSPPPTLNTRKSLAASIQTSFHHPPCDCVSFSGQIF